MPWFGFVEERVLMSSMLTLGSVVDVTDSITSTRAVVPVTNPTGLVDPDVITVDVEDPTGVRTSLLPTRLSLGVYRVTLTLLTHGTWTVRFIASGVGGGSNPPILLVVERVTSGEDLH